MATAQFYVMLEKAFKIVLMTIGTQYGILSI